MKNLFYSIVILALFFNFVDANESEDKVKEQIEELKKDIKEEGRILFSINSKEYAPITTRKRFDSRKKGCSVDKKLNYKCYYNALKTMFDEYKKKRLIATK